MQGCRDPFVLKFLFVVVRRCRVGCRDRDHVNAAK